MSVLDDPEDQFRRFPAVLKRWTWRAIRMRLRTPFRRRRWDRKNRSIVAPYRIINRQGRATPEGEGLTLALGDFSGHTGLSRAGLYELDRLREHHPDIIVRDMGPAIKGDAIPIPEEGPPIRQLYLLSAPDTYRTLLQAISPERIQDAWRTGLWVWETPAFPSHWRFAIDLVDEIWTPSDYSRRAILPAVGSIPVSLRPHAVKVMPENKGHSGIMRKQLNIPADAFFGLAIMDIASCPARKNPWAHIAAWQQAFGDHPKRVLVLKIRVSKTTRVVLQELKTMIGEAQNIRLLEAEMTIPEIEALQEEADVYLSFHRAEGYGLTIHEALALGTPTLATDFSANAEYGMQFSEYQGLPYRLVPYRDWTGHYVDKDFEWAEIDQEAAIRALKTMADRKNSL